VNTVVNKWGKLEKNFRAQLFCAPPLFNILFHPRSWKQTKFTRNLPNLEQFSTNKRVRFTISHNLDYTTDYISGDVRKSYVRFIPKNLYVQTK